MPYTDGATEALNADREEFQLERIGNAVRAGSLNPEDIVDRLVRAVVDFTGAEASLRDDLTIVALRRPQAEQAEVADEQAVQDEGPTRDGSGPRTFTGRADEEPTPPKQPWPGPPRRAGGALALAKVAWAGWAPRPRGL